MVLAVSHNYFGLVSHSHWRQRNLVRVSHNHLKPGLLGKVVENHNCLMLVEALRWTAADWQKVNHNCCQQQLVEENHS